MAHLTVTIPESTTLERRTDLVRNLTETVGNILNIPTEQRHMISIRMLQYGKNEVARGGVLVVDERKANLFHIDVYAPKLEFDQKQELTQHLNNAFCESLRLGGEERRHVFVTVHEFKPENVSSGGHLLRENVRA